MRGATSSPTWPSSALHRAASGCRPDARPTPPTPACRPAARGACHERGLHRPGRRHRPRLHRPADRRRRWPPAASRSSASTSTRAPSRPSRTARSPSSSPTWRSAVSGAVAMGRLTATTETPRGGRLHHRGADAVQRRPHRRPVATCAAAVEQIAPRLRGGEIVILESTSPPGHDRAVSRWLAELRPDLDAPARARRACPTSTSRTARSGCCPAGS